jgi:monoamine oxidase
MSRSLYDKLHKRFGPTLPASEITARANGLIDEARPLLSAAAAPLPCKARLAKTRVAIVGGGCAGAMAAWWLGQREKSIEIVLFEARNRLGGRVFSNRAFAEGRVIEFGAELVGANHPVWLGLARDLGVGLMTRTGEGDFGVLDLRMKVRIDGKDIDDKTARKLTDDMTAVFKAIGKDADKITDAARPWKQPELKKFDGMSVADKLTRPTPDGLGLKKDQLLFRGLELLIVNDLLSPLANINYLGLLCLVKAGRFATDKEKDRDEDYLGYWQQTEVFRCVDGCQALVEKMVARLTDPKEKYKFNLFLSTPVTAIAVDATKPRPVTLTWAKSAAADRAKLDPSFDYVIMTLPPSLWDDIEITAQHPKNTIGRPQMGPAVKFFSNLKDRFWIGEKAAPSGISSEIGMIWEGTDNQTLVGKQEIELSVYAGGFAKTGRTLTESDFTRELRRLYPGYRASNRGKKTELVDWFADKWSKTGFSCPRPGHMFTMAPELRLPLNDGRLFLAGDYTQTDFFGFMEGALRSGQRVAEAVIATVCPEAVRPDFPVG